MNPKLKALKNKITGSVANILSAPKRAYYSMEKASADTDTNILKSARAYKSAPKFEVGKGPTDAFKAQSMADQVKANRMKK